MHDMMEKDGGDAPRVQKSNSGLGKRLVVGLLLAIGAFLLIWHGKLPFTTLLAAATALIYWEWCAMQKIGPAWRVAGAVILSLAMALTHIDYATLAFSTIGVGALVLWVAASTVSQAGKRWIVSGLMYAGLPGIALIWMRDMPDGFALVMWAMGLVWATDILAYFAGRAIGGPKIWAAISPNKTWAGLIGGMTGAALFSAAFAHFQQWDAHLGVMLLLGAVLAVLAQAGDFFESWLKRNAGVKDSGSILPGHGGLMDRLDGLVPVACVVALFVAYEIYRPLAQSGFGSMA